MTESKRRERLARLKRTIEGATERKLETTYRNIVAEIAELEASAPKSEPKERKAPASPNRKRTSGRNRAK